MTVYLDRERAHDQITGVPRMGMVICDDQHPEMGNDWPALTSPSSGQSFPRLQCLPKFPHEQDTLSVSISGRLISESPSKEWRGLPSIGLRDEFVLPYEGVILSDHCSHSSMS